MNTRVAQIVFLVSCVRDAFFITYLVQLCQVS